MPRRTRAYQETDASRTLDEVVKRYDRTEKQLAAISAELKEAVVAMGREVLAKQSDLTLAEVARRVGWSREYVSRVVAEANKRDGWTPDA
jgi:DNA-directed RNA polymerase specialized sigma subunit